MMTKTKPGTDPNRHEPGQSEPGTDPKHHEPGSVPREWLVPDWPAPANVRAFVTTRSGGVSTGEYASMNLGFSSGDERERVIENRRIVREVLPADPVYLRQLHGIQG